METTTIEGVELTLAHPDDLHVEWVGQDFVAEQLRAAWRREGPGDLALNPRILGRPGVGKTALAYAMGRALGREVYLVQATMDTRPEDLLITPVLAEGGKLRYVASGLVTAMIRGGVCVLDEGNRMTEKAWASLAPLLDTRRYVESVVAGIKVQAHPDFLFCSTMNEDASTFEIPEYIQSRLQPRIVLDFPEPEEELAILRANLPAAEPDLLAYVGEFLHRAHQGGEPFTVRDGVNIARYALKLGAAQAEGRLGPLPEPARAAGPTSGPAALRTLAGGGAAAFDLNQWFRDALEGALGDAAGKAGTGKPGGGKPGAGKPAGADSASDEEDGTDPDVTGPIRLATPLPPPWDGTSLQARVQHATQQVLGDEALPYLPRA